MAQSKTKDAPKRVKASSVAVKLKTSGPVGTRKSAVAEKLDTYHHGDLKSTLLDAALRMLKTRAPGELSLRELAREAGVSQAAPYRHFKNKEELLAAIMKQGFDLKYRYMREAMEAFADQPLERYFNCGLAYFRMGLKHPQHFKLMFSSEICIDRHPELLMAATATFVLLRNMITDSQSAGIFGAGDPYHRALNCWSVVHGFTTLHVEDRMRWLGVTNENSEIALRGLLSQYLTGSAQPTTSRSQEFDLFQTSESKLSLQMMEQMK